jgi:putative transcriptional regulator
MIHAGDLLIAPPKMSDPRFFHSVILITQANLRGVQGLCLNRDSGITVNRALAALPKKITPDEKLFWGGPVGSSTLWLLHDSEWSCDNTNIITDQWRVSSSNNMFEQIAQQGGPNHARFMLGISSWAPGQLEMEIEGSQPWNRDSSWLIARAPEPKEILSLVPSDVWLYACDLSAQQTVKDWI